MNRLRLALVLCVCAGLRPALAAEPAWPFRPLAIVSPPHVKHADRSHNGIDAFVLAKLEETGLSPAPEAAPLTLLRRIYYDLIGLPPTPAEVDSFLNDPNADAYENVVERLLADPRYGERWARLWLDLARYADTAGYEGDPDLPHAWRYRDYVIDAFNHDKPYDLFVKEQIAGDEFKEIMGAGDLPATDPERVTALTFLRLAPFTEPRGDKTRHEMLNEMTATVGSVFLGLTVGCAQCHDHKYDGIPTKDFYRLKAFFSTVQIPRPERGDSYQIGGPLPADFYRPGEKEWAAKLRAKYTQQLEETNDALRNLKAADDKTLTEKQKARRLDLSGRQRRLEQQLKRLRPVAMSLRHSYGPPYEPGVPTSRVMIRGEYDNPGEVVQPGFLSCITGNQEPAAVRLDPFKRWPTRSRRMALAKWIANSKNPLTARVMVNRLWHWHFGRGIVATPSDFGALSGGPSHPELLDWLATQFVQQGWSLKTLHRLMVTSSTYRQTSQHADAEAEQLDPDNKLRWRFSQRRLEAEAIRDAVLAVSGRLNPEQSGLPIFPPLPGDIAEAIKYTDNKWDTQYGPQGRKRSIYIYQQRTLTMPFMQAFDSLVCDESRALRSSSVTPIQALALYNGAFVSAEASCFAQRVHEEVGDDPARRIECAFRLALCRRPTRAETVQMEQFLRSGPSPNESLVGLCRILFNLNEFAYID